MRSRVCDTYVYGPGRGGGDTRFSTTLLVRYMFLLVIVTTDQSHYCCVWSSNPVIRRVSKSLHRKQVEQVTNTVVLHGLQALLCVLSSH